MELIMEQKNSFFPDSVRDNRVRDYIAPVGIVMSYGAENEQNLIGALATQMTLTPPAGCTLVRGGYVLLDFGREFSGGLKILVSKVESSTKNATLFIRYGESVTEALTPVGKSGATNDHATREFSLDVSFLSSNETGESGLRFAYVSLIDGDAVEISAILGVFCHSPSGIVGTFECSDKKLTKIWQTAAYTAYLCMQQYIYDGIKRDRLVWAGDLYTEMRTILAAVGPDESIRRTLKFLSDTTPDGNWMNGISSYSIWWLICVFDYAVATGDEEFLDDVRPKLFELISRLTTEIGEDGAEELDGARFVDWKIRENKEATHAGLQSLLKKAMSVGTRLCEMLDNRELAAECRECERELSKHVPSPVGSKQAAALMAYSGLMSPIDADGTVLSVGGPRGYSTFMSYLILRAKAEAGNIAGALTDMRAYFGAMLDLGATTFWEDFDIELSQGGARIDMPVEDGGIDVHADFGEHCYSGLRRSLCHGWASGPCAFLSEYVLGVKQISPYEFTVRPDLGPLKWARGKYPTAYGEIEVEARVMDGKTLVKVKAPKGVKIRK